jgi:rare lipoprotein A (peptidoglycan hydrolase)
VLTAIAALVVAGCGSTGDPAHTQRSTHPAQASAPGPATSSTTAAVTVPSAHPNAVEPTAGQAGSSNAAAHSSGAAGARTTGTSPSHPQITGPASVTSAPAKGAPTTAQVRNALLRLTTVERRYRLDRVDYTNALLTPSEIPPGKWLTSIASFYGAPLFGNGVACGGILHPWTLGVANKTLPCGTKVLFRYGGRAIEVKVIDRGPYIAGREWDLTAATAVALHFPGLGPVQWRLVR